MVFQIRESKWTLLISTLGITIILRLSLEKLGCLITLSITQMLPNVPKPAEEQQRLRNPGEVTCPPPPWDLARLQGRKRNQLAGVLDPTASPAPSYSGHLEVEFPLHT